MKKYVFYSRRDSEKESYGYVISFSRLQAARSFAERKRLSLKDFLRIYEVSR
jgi:hypothetical protein